MSITELRLSIISRLSGIENCIGILRCEISSPDTLPDDKIIEKISEGISFLKRDFTIMKNEVERIRKNEDDKICPQLNSRYGCCLAPCGGCPTPDRLDCGGRWNDGHNAHIGQCAHVADDVPGPSRVEKEPAIAGR